MSNSRSYQPVLICDVLNASGSNPGLVALANLSAAVLPDGAEAYVVATRVMYRLVKALTAPTGAQVAAQGGGVWVPQSGLTTSPGTISAENLSAKAITLTGTSNFLVMPSSAASFGEFYNGGNWALDTASGQLTYLGTGRPYLFSITATLYSSVTVGDTIMGIRLDGVTLNSRVEASAPVATGASSFFSLSLTGVIPVIPQAGVLDVVFAGEAATLTVTQCIYTLVPLT